MWCGLHSKPNRRRVYNHLSRLLEELASDMLVLNHMILYYNNATCMPAWLRIDCVDRMPASAPQLCCTSCLFTGQPPWRNGSQHTAAPLSLGSIPALVGLVPTSRCIALSSTNCANKCTPTKAQWFKILVVERPFLEVKLAVATPD